jgi:uncharacterized protein
MTAHRILWRRIDLPGHEVATLESRDSGWRLSGTAVFAHDRRACKLDYLVTCDDAWRTTAAHVTGGIGDLEIDVRVSVDAERRWFANGAECSAVRGCLDIDLGFSPSTNLLPIRRLYLAIGEEASVSAAWLPFPSFAFELLPQVYRRDGERTYRYESRGGAFVRMLDVNAVGFVTRYPDFWEEDADN